MKSEDKKITLVDIETGEQEIVSLEDYMDINSNEYPWTMLFLVPGNDVCVAKYSGKDVNTTVESIDLDTGEVIDEVAFGEYIRVLEECYEMDYAEDENIHIIAVKEKEYTEFIRKDYTAWLKSFS